jgi:transcriptional regulator with XRE-family HTH domain
MANLSIIRDISKSKNIPFNELSTRVGITPHGLQRIIKSNSTKVETLEKIADALQVDITVFFGSSNNFLEIAPTDLFKNEALKFIAHRIESYYEKLNLYRDVFIWKVLESVNQSASSKTLNINPDEWSKFIPDHLKQLFINIPTEAISKPYCSWRSEEKNKIKVGLFLDEFYRMLFETNFMNIADLLRDEVIHNEDVITHWNEWKKSSVY